jgi:RHS repeat-associated protein
VTRLEFAHEPDLVVYCEGRDGWTGARGFFTGERWEAYSQLLFLRARYYEPSSGRFLTKDPWSGDLQHPLTLQGWLYVRNNPTNAIDPSGWYDYNEVHYGLTRQWAFEIASGFGPILDPERIAEAIAAGDRRTDTNIRLTSVTCITCHFCDPDRTRAHMNDAVNSCNPYFFGHILHQAQDFYSHWNEGYHWEHLSHTQANRPQDKLDDFFLGGHYAQIGDPGSETGTYEVWVESPYPAHPREQVEHELRVRNLGLVVSGMSRDELIDLYLRDEPGTDPEFWEMRDYFKFNTDEYFEGSRRDIIMELESRRYILRFMMHLVVGCCRVDWEDAVVQDAHATLTAR